MWPILAGVLLNSSNSSNALNATKSMFSKEQVIFSSSCNITKLLVYADDNKFLLAEYSEQPSIFFTVLDPHFEGGSCIYVLAELAAYEILEGGRDSTADYGSDKNVYFGASDGIYKYDKDSLSAKKFGLFKDDIIQIQKANGTDKIYYLTDEKKLYVMESNGTVRSKVEGIMCATQFVLDTSNNIYYVECKTNAIFIVKTSSSRSYLVGDDFEEVKLIRPAFIMEDCIPLLGDGNLYVLYVNGTTESKDFFIAENASAFSIDTALYLVVALDGRIYEYNVMDVLLRSMYGLGLAWNQDVNKIIMSVVGGYKDVFAYSHKGPK